MDLAEVLGLILVSPILLAFGMIALAIGVMAAIFLVEGVFIIVSAVIIAAKTILGPVFTTSIMSNAEVKRERQSFNPIVVVIQTNAELEKSFTRMEQELNKMKRRLNRRK